MNEGEQVIQVKRIIADPGYGRLNNDIALLELEKPVMFGKHVQPVCLPKQGEKPAVGSTCYITGMFFNSHPALVKKKEILGAVVVIYFFVRWCLHWSFIFPTRNENHSYVNGNLFTRLHNNRGKRCIPSDGFIPHLKDWYGFHTSL